MKVCVVGAGPSGLTTVKQLLDEGHEVTCFEKNDNIGGIWYRSTGDDGEMKVFDSLMLTISMKLMSFSDHIIEGERVFYTHKEYFRYLEEYADKFNLRPHIALSTKVKNIEKTENGGWRVTVEAGGQSSAHTFDALAICVGPFQQPQTNVDGIKQFTGEVYHSYSYRNAKPFRNKRVLVIGLAESGADLVREISDVASECTLAIRQYTWLLPRLYYGVHATDAMTTRAHHYEAFVRSQKMDYPSSAIFGETRVERAAFVASTVLYTLAMAAAKLLRPAERGNGAPPAKPKNLMGEDMFPLKMDIGTEWNFENAAAMGEWNRRSHAPGEAWSQKVIFCKNVSFIPNIVNGKILVNDAGIDTMRGNRVYFKNGDSREFDVIVLCTGFKKDFAMLGKDVAVTDNNVRYLYKHAFHPDHDGRLAYIGFVRPFSGAIPLCAEMQARYFAQLCSGNIKLPADVRERIRREKAWEEAHTTLSPRHTESIPSQTMFLDSMAKEIGCLLPLRKLIFNPGLLMRHWFYSFNQACYRLVGPHAMPEAAMRELMGETPGPRGENKARLAFAGLSLLPYFIYPKDTPPPGHANPPMSSEPRRPHFLRRDRAARTKSVAKPAPSAPPM